MSKVICNKLQIKDYKFDYKLQLQITNYNYKLELQIGHILQKLPQRRDNPIFVGMLPVNDNDHLCKTQSLALTNPSGNCPVL